MRSGERRTGRRGFPLRAAHPLPVDTPCLLYMPAAPCGERGHLSDVDVELSVMQLPAPGQQLPLQGAAIAVHLDAPPPCKIHAVPMYDVSCRERYAWTVCFSVSRAPFNAWRVASSCGISPDQQQPVPSMRARPSGVAVSPPPFFLVAWAEGKGVTSLVPCRRELARMRQARSLCRQRPVRPIVTQSAHTQCNKIP